MKGFKNIESKDKSNGGNSRSNARNFKKGGPWKSLEKKYKKVKIIK